MKPQDTAGEDILVVIPCLNEAAHLPALLQRMIDETDGLVVVADGGSTDGSRELVQRLADETNRLVLLDNPDRRQAAGVNRAVLRHGTGRRWLVRVDAHCDYPDHYAARLVATAAHNGATAVVVPMISRGGGCFQQAAAAAQNSVLGTGGSPHRHVGIGKFVDHGHHALIDLAHFRVVGGYHSGMSHNEDAELDRRLTDRGAAIWLEPSLAIIYYPRRDPIALWRQYRNHGRGRARTAMLHDMRLKPRQLAPLLVPLAALAACLSPIWPLLALPFLCWTALCLGAGLVVGLRHGGRCALFAGAAAMIMHLAWGLGFLEQRLFGRTPALAPPWPDQAETAV